MDTLGLLLVNAWTIFQLWIVSLRRTINLKSITLFFLVGLFGTTIVAFILHFLTTRLLNPQVVAYTLNPFVEESVKVVPILIFLWFCRKARHNMGILDIMLLALAAGTGFEVGESLLYNMGHSNRHYVNSIWLPSITPYSDYYFTHFKHTLRFVFAGHGVMAAAIGVAVGFALYMKTTPKLAKVAWLVPLAVFLWTVYDHCMVNYLLSDTLFGIVTTKLNSILQIIYFFDRAGGLIVSAFTLSLILAIYLEERVVMNQLADEKHFRLEGEKSAVVLMGEFQVAVDKLSKGWKYLLELFAFFGSRRQLAYYKYFAKGFSAQEDQIHLDYLRAVIAEKQSRLREMEQIPTTDAWNFQKGLQNIKNRTIDKFKTLNADGWLTVVLLLTWVVLFILQPNALRRSAGFYYLVLFLAAIGAIRTFVVYLRVLKAPKPDLSRMDSNGAVAHFSAVALTHLSAALTILAVAAYFLPWVKMVNEWHLYFLWNAFQKFYNNWGLHLPGMLGVNAGLLSALPGLLLPDFQPGGAKTPTPTPTPGAGNEPIPQPAPTPTPYATPTPSAPTPGVGDKPLPQPAPAQTPEISEAELRLRRIKKYQKAIDDALQNPDNLPQGPITYCNRFVADVAAKLGINELKDMTADQQYTYVSNSNQWKEVNSKEAQEAANNGKLVLGLTPKGSGEHGHSTIVAPGHDMEWSDTCKESVPVLYDANRATPTTPRKATGCYIYSQNKPRWFVRK